MVLGEHDYSMHPIKPLLAEANVEVIPLRGAEAKLVALPRNGAVTITSSPKFGLERTLEHVEVARRVGLRVVPHLAARMVSGERELMTFVSRLHELGVDDIFVVGGDNNEPRGPYAEAFDVLEVLGSLKQSFRRLGVACYPEGHPRIDAQTLLETLRLKQRYATYMVSQLCFDPVAMIEWLHLVREAGVTLPLRIGLAGPLQMRKLLELSLRIGVGTSAKFLTRQHGVVGGLVLGSAYAPEEFLASLAAGTDLDVLRVEGVHMFSFNQIESTANWLSRHG